MSVLLYLATILFWGCSWLAIKWQEGIVPVPQSIFYRFAVAAVILMVLVVLTKKLRRTSLKDHVFFVLQALCLFSCNFILFYSATSYIASGLVALVMSTATLFNPILNKLCWGQGVNRQFVWGATFGTLGLVVVFWPTLFAQGVSWETLKGILLALGGTLMFSCGNMISLRHARAGVNAMTANAWAMCYGCVILFVMITSNGAPWQWQSGQQYLLALLYLAIFASVVGFSVYLALVVRIGPNKAAYALVVTPVVALTLSSLFENYQWSLLGGLGLLLVVLGNVLVLAQWPSPLLKRVLRHLLPHGLPRGLKRTWQRVQQWRRSPGTTVT